MTNEKMVNEFSRWLNNGKGKIWYRGEIGIHPWELLRYPSWETIGHYVTNDEHSELRKLQVDKPDTKFEYIWDSGGVWRECIPGWNTNREYRVKLETVYEWQWLYASDEPDVYLLLTDFFMTEQECIDRRFSSMKKLEETKRIRNV